jgi:DNA mismatch endonuclease (patch repair protein)
MAANRRRDTGVERAVRSRLHARGLRFRVDFPIRPDGAARSIRPDVVFPRLRIALFIDGCFWHGCPIHGTLPATTNADYWRSKISENRARDARHDAELTAAGWTVARAWEHEDPDAVASRVSSLVKGSAAVVRTRTDRSGPTRVKD